MPKVPEPIKPKPKKKTPTRMTLKDYLMENFPTEVLRDIYTKRDLAVPGLSRVTNRIELITLFKKYLLDVIDAVDKAFIEEGTWVYMPEMFSYGNFITCNEKSFKDILCSITLFAIAYYAEEIVKERDLSDLQSIT